MIHKYIDIQIRVVSYHHMCCKILGGIFMLVCRDVPCSMYCVKLSPKLRLDIELSVVKMIPSVFSGECIKALPEYVLKSCFVLIINEGLSTGSDRPERSRR